MFDICYSINKVTLFQHYQSPHYISFTKVYIIRIYFFAFHLNIANHLKTSFWENFYNYRESEWDMTVVLVHCKFVLTRWMTTECKFNYCSLYRLQHALGVCPQIVIFVLLIRRNLLHMELANNSRQFCVHLKHCIKNWEIYLQTHKC